MSDPGHGKNFRPLRYWDWGSGPQADRWLLRFFDRRAGACEHPLHCRCETSGLCIRPWIPEATLTVVSWRRRHFSCALHAVFKLRKQRTSERCRKNSLLRRRCERLSFQTTSTGFTREARRSSSPICEARSSFSTSGPTVELTAFMFSRSCGSSN